MISQKIQNIELISELLNYYLDVIIKAVGGPLATTEFQDATTSLKGVYLCMPDITKVSAKPAMTTPLMPEHMCVEIWEHLGEFSQGIHEQGWSWSHALWSITSAYVQNIWLLVSPKKEKEKLGSCCMSNGISLPFVSITYTGSGSRLQSSLTCSGNKALR